MASNCADLGDGDEEKQKLRLKNGNPTNNFQEIPTKNMTYEEYKRQKTQEFEELLRKKLDKISNKSHSTQLKIIEELIDRGYDSDSEYNAGRKREFIEKLSKECEMIKDARKAHHLAANIFGFEVNDHPHIPSAAEVISRGVITSGLTEALVNNDSAKLKRIFPQLTNPIIKEIFANFTDYIIKTARHQESKRSLEESKSSWNKSRPTASLYKKENVPENFLRKNRKNIIVCNEDASDYDSASSSDLESNMIWDPKPILGKIYKGPALSRIVGLFTGIKIRWKVEDYGIPRNQYQAVPVPPGSLKINAVPTPVPKRMSLYEKWQKLINN